MRGLLKVWVFLIGFFGFANVLIGWAGAWVRFASFDMPAYWIGYLCLGVAAALTMLGRKRSS